MRRRDLITLLGGAAATPLLWPVSAASQSTKTWRVGVIGPRPETAAEGMGYPAILEELRKVGFTEGRNLVVDYRWNDQETRAVFADAADLVRTKPDVLVAIGPEVTLQAAIAASSTIPIVIAAINYDPIAGGYVKSLAQPGGNITGLFVRQPELAVKQVELLAQTFPNKTKPAILWDAPATDQFTAAERMAKSVRLDVRALKLQNPPYDFDAAFKSLVQNSPQMLFVLSSQFFNPQRKRIADLAIQHKLPTMFTFKVYVTSGGLMSYGVDFVTIFRRAGYYAAKVLCGAKPNELPVEQPTNFELVINLKTAKAIGIEMPTSILLRADEVIE